MHKITFPILQHAPKLGFVIGGRGYFLCFQKHWLISVHTEAGVKIPTNFVRNSVANTMCFK